MQVNVLLTGDAIKVLKTLPSNSVDCCVTSPPYYRLRDYGIKGQLGLEATPEAYIRKLVLVFREVRRVLKPTGTCWINISDSYAGTWKPGINKKSNLSVSLVKTKLKKKDLIGIPWMLAFALRKDGWYLRQEIIWSKTNPMPESVTDRCTKSHEQIFLLSKSKKYYFDAEAIKTDAKKAIDNRGLNKNVKRKPTQEISAIRESGMYPKANKRSVWSVAAKGYDGDHFATYPEKLITDCIKAGAPTHGCCGKCGKPYERIVQKVLVPGKGASFKTVTDKRDTMADKQDQGSNRVKDGHKPGWVYESITLGIKATCKCDSPKIEGIVLDPFNGRGTTCIVAKKNNCSYIGIDINPKDIEAANERIHKELGLFK